MIVFILIIFTAIYFPGIILRTKSILSGRKGPGIFQPMKDLRVLFMKGSVFSRTSGIIFRIAPAITLASIICAALLIPLGNQKAMIAFEGDFIFFAYLLAFGRFFAIIAAMDTGSSFEGMGANREALYAMLAEPAFFVLFGSLALLTGHQSMNDIFETFRLAGPQGIIIGVIAVYLLIQIAMIENSRMPVDDPKTHLELTMVHEVMILDYSGFDLAIIQTATALKFGIYGTLIANIILPATGTFIWLILLSLVIQGLFASLIGFLESFRARKKLAKNPQFIFTLSSIAMVAFILILLIIFIIPGQ